MDIPILDSMPYWKYSLRTTPVNHLWIALALFCLGLAILFSFSNLNNLLKLLLLILVGSAIQFSLAYSKGQGLEGIRNRISDSGHTEFAKVAVEQPGMRHAMQNYEWLAKQKTYDYIPSKPPGTLLFYMVTERVSWTLFPSSDSETRLQNLYTLASMAWPVLSYFVLVPLFILAREFFKSTDAAIITCLFYMVVPSVNLITLHTDQVIFPFMVTVTVLIAAVALRKNNLLLSVLSGIAFYGIVYFSFGLAIIGFLFPVLLFVAVPENTLRPFLSSIKHAGAILFGVVVSHVLVSRLLNYDIVVRYHRALAHHLSWKDWENTLSTYLQAGITDITEFSVWVGLPLILLFWICVAFSIRQWIFRKPDFLSFYSLSLAGIFVILLVIGKTKAETARLWLFLVPFLCLCAAGWIKNQEWPRRYTLAFVTTILLLEMGTTYFTLHYQDFW